MDNSKRVHNDMNISNFIQFFLTDKWSLGGAIGCIMSFISPLLVTLVRLHEVIGLMSAFIGLCVAALSLYKLSMQVARETWEFDQLLKGKKNDESEQD